MTICEDASLHEEWGKQGVYDHIGSNRVITGLAEGQAETCR